jgi:hypothetical protein
MGKRELRHEAEIRRLIDEHEREVTRLLFHEVESLAAEHRRAHEREHEYVAEAIDKSTTSADARVSALTTEVARLAAQHPLFLTIERFEREHASLGAQIATEEKVTVRQSAQQELIDRVGVNNRWLVGILVTVAIFGATTLLHVFKVI